MGRVILHVSLLFAALTAPFTSEASVCNQRWKRGGGRAILAMRGGGGPKDKGDMEVVCDGNVCELRPKKSKAAKTKKAAATKGGREDSDVSGGWLEVLRRWLCGGSGGKKNIFQRALSFFGLGGGDKAIAADYAADEDAAEDARKGGKCATVGSPAAAKESSTRKDRRAAFAASKRRARVGGGAGGSRASSALRIQRELRDFQTNPPPNLAVNVRPDNLNVWVITVTGVDGTLYQGEKYKLRIEFSMEYPTKPPSVYFLKPTPRHQHVYTNGDICLDLLGRGWKPQLTVRTLAISILSMLSSAKEKGIPPDNANHADNAPGKPQVGWLYHDDHC